MKKLIIASSLIISGCNGDNAESYSVEPVWNEIEWSQSHERYWVLSESRDMTPISTPMSLDVSDLYSIGVYGGGSIGHFDALVMFVNYDWSAKLNNFVGLASNNRMLATSIYRNNRKYEQIVKNVVNGVETFVRINPSDNGIEFFASVDESYPSLHGDCIVNGSWSNLECSITYYDENGGSYHSVNKNVNGDYIESWLGFSDEKKFRTDIATDFIHSLKCL